MPGNMPDRIRPRAKDMGGFIKRKKETLSTGLFFVL